MDNKRRQKGKSAPYVKFTTRRQQLNENYSEEEEEQQDEEESEDSEYYPENPLRKCHEHTIKTNNKKSKNNFRKTVKFSNQKMINRQEISFRRQQMFLNFSKLQVDESFSIDFHRNLYAKFERTESILNALQQYVDCLNLELKASYRLCSEISGLVVNDNSIKMTEDVLNLIKTLCQSQLIDGNNSITNTILSSLQIDQDITHSTKEYDRRKKDFNIATRNFRLLLNECEFNVPQMEILQRQYEGILF